MQVVGHLRDLQDGQQLSLFHLVAYVNGDLFHIAGHLGHDVHFLKRLEFSRQDQISGKVCRYDLGDGDGWRLARGGGVSFLARTRDEK